MAWFVRIALVKEGAVLAKVAMRLVGGACLFLPLPSLTFRVRFPNPGRRIASARPPESGRLNPRDERRYS